MFRVLIVSLMVAAWGCSEVAGEARTEIAATALPPPSSTCPGGYSNITAHQAAKNIAEQYCISLGQDYDSLCMAPVVARYCPDIAACQQNLCLDLMDTLGACMQIFPPSPDCAVLFPPSIGGRRERTLLMSGLSAVASNGNAFYTPHSTYITSTGPTVVSFGFDLEGCDTLKHVRFSAIGDAFVDATAYVTRTSTIGGPITVGEPLGMPNVSPILQTYEIDIPDTPIVPGDAVSLRVVIQGPDMSMSGVTVTVDR